MPYKEILLLIWSLILLKCSNHELWNADALLNTEVTETRLVFVSQPINSDMTGFCGSTNFTSNSFQSTRDYARCICNWPKVSKLNYFFEPYLRFNAYLNDFSGANMVWRSIDEALQFANGDYIASFSTLHAGLNQQLNGAMVSGKVFTENPGYAGEKITYGQLGASDEISITAGIDVSGSSWGYLYCVERP